MSQRNQNYMLQSLMGMDIFYLLLVASVMVNFAQWGNWIQHTSEAKKTIDVIRKENTQLRKENTDLKSQVEKLDKVIAKLKAEVDRLKGKVVIGSQSTEELQNLVIELRQKVHDLEGKNTRLVNLNRKLKNEIKALDKKLQDALALLSVAQKDKRKLDTTNWELHKKNAELERENRELLKENRKLKEINEFLQAENNRLSRLVGVQKCETPFFVIGDKAGLSRFKSGTAKLNENLKQTLRASAKDIIKKANEFGTKHLEIIGHTDGAKLDHKSTSNLDTKLPGFLDGYGNPGDLSATDNVGLGIMRAVAVAHFLKNDRQIGRMFSDYTILPASSGPMVQPDHSLSSKEFNSVEARRRIEIRILKFSKSEN